MMGGVDRHSGDTRHEHDPDCIQSILSDIDESIFLLTSFSLIALKVLALGI